MDIDEFKQTQKPRAKRSRLDPFLDKIFELKRDGYANSQVAEWLGKNGVEVSGEGVRKFIISRESCIAPAFISSANSASASFARAVSPSSNPISEGVESSQSDDMVGLDNKQKREKLADKFIGDQANPKNSLANRIIKQENIK